MAASYPPTRLLLTYQPICLSPTLPTSPPYLLAYHILYDHILLTNLSPYLIFMYAFGH